MYQSPGDNPYFKERKKQSDRERAKTFTNRGIADQFRKYADL